MQPRVRRAFIRAELKTIYRAAGRRSLRARRCWPLDDRALSSRFAAITAVSGADIGPMSFPRRSAAGSSENSDHGLKEWGRLNVLADFPPVMSCY